MLHDAEEGATLSQDDLQRLTSNNDSPDGELSSAQREALLDEGSGLKDWGRGKVSVYNEGSNLIICDEEGESSKEFGLMQQVMSRSGEYMGRKRSRVNKEMHSVWSLTCTLRSAYEVTENYSLLIVKELLRTTLIWKLAAPSILLLVLLSGLTSFP